MSGPAEEAERARQMRELESLGRREPDPNDYVTVVRIRLPEHADRYSLARWSLAARLVRDAASAGRAGEITDLGPEAMDAARSIGVEDLAPGKVLHVGDAKGGRWITWLLPVPPEPVPGSPRQRGQRN